MRWKRAHVEGLRRSLFITEAQPPRKALPWSQRQGLQRNHETRINFGPLRDARRTPDLQLAGDLQRLCPSRTRDMHHRAVAVRQAQYEINGPVRLVPSDLDQGNYGLHRRLRTCDRPPCPKHMNLARDRVTFGEVTEDERSAHPQTIAAAAATRMGSVIAGSYVTLVREAWEGGTGM